MMISFKCLDCGHSWKARKAITRYVRQCPKCDSYKLKKVSPLDSEAAFTNGPPANLKWPKPVYDLMGISGSNSPQNAVARALELYKRALPYKFKYGVENLEEVFRLLEKKVVDADGKASDAEKTLKRILDDPTLIFWEIGGDLIATKYYEAVQKTGCKVGFLEFLNDVVEAYFKEMGYNSPEEFLEYTKE